MVEVKEIKIKNRTYCFYKDMINIKDFESHLLRIDKNTTKDWQRKSFVVEG